jgi:radical SAM protein with 4Fe4S-binding SPASM domain
MTIADDRYLCVAPWIHMYVRPNGDAFPCCVAPMEMPVGNLNAATLEEVWNSPGMKRLRRTMLQGRPSPECRRCYKHERSGVYSNRERLNEMFGHHLDKTATTRADGHVDKVSLPYWSFTFSNICNLRCRTCGPELSSEWHREGKIVNPAYDLDKVMHSGGDPEALLKQLEPHYQELEAIYFAGGEPLLTPQHWTILHRLLDMGRTGVFLRYNTNFMQLSYKGEDVCGLWNRFDRVDVYASLDGMGARGEYIRKNLRWDTIERNRDHLRRHTGPQVRFFVTVTVSIMNIHHLFDFLPYLVASGFVEQDGYSLNLLVEPDWYSVTSLPPDHKRRITERLNDLRHDTTHASHTPHFFREMQACVDFMNAADTRKALGDGARHAALLDRLRGERFDDVLPELAGVFGLPA